MTQTYNYHRSNFGFLTPFISVTFQSNLQVVCPHILKHAVASVSMRFHAGQKLLQRKKSNLMGANEKSRLHNRSSSGSYCTHATHIMFTEIVYS